MIDRDVLKALTAEPFTEGGLPAGIRTVERPVLETKNQGDYVVSYEVIFEPVSIKHMRLEIWLTNRGEVAIGLETQERVAQRIGCRVVRHGFASGHEPREVTADGLHTLLAAVANGELSIGFSAALGMLWSTWAVVRLSVLQRLNENRYGDLSWLSEGKEYCFSGAVYKRTLGGVVNYSPWLDPN